MTDTFAPKAPAGISMSIFKKLVSAQGTMGRGKGISFPFPSSPARSFPLSPDPKPPFDLPYDTKSPLRSREKGSCMNGGFVFATLQTSEELEPKYIPQLFMGLLLVTHRSVIGQLFLCR